MTWSPTVLHGRDGDYRHVIDFARRGWAVVYDEDDPATKKRYAGGGG